MNIPCDNMFLLVLYIMTLMTFDHFLKKIDIGDTFWKKKWSRAHIYNMVISRDKIFLLVSKLVTFLLHNICFLKGCP